MMKRAIMAILLALCFTFSAQAAEVKFKNAQVHDPSVMEAWEHGEDKRYIPVKFKNGAPSSDALADLERLGLLSRHIKKELGGMAKQLRAGSIAADPWYRSRQDNACLNCDYAAACAFQEGQGGEQSRYLAKLSTEEVWARMEEVDQNG